MSKKEIRALRASSEETILRATKALAGFDKAVKKAFYLPPKEMADYMA